MIRNYFLINLLLIVIIGVLGLKLYKVLTYSVEIPSEVSVREVRKDDIDIIHKDKTVTEGEFDPISKLDLFRPSRSEYDKEDKKADNALQKIPPKLFGTVILNEKKTAILEDPNTKTTRIYRINDVIAGYKILEILADKVVLSGDGDNVEVRLRDAKGIIPSNRPAVRPAPVAPRQGISNAPFPGQVETGAQVQRRPRPVPPRTRPDGIIPPPQPEKNIEPPELPMPTGSEGMEHGAEPQ
ncbi:MAG: hypothetical protein HY757_08575 [Nitrospirae bacterium]|nr:hypothetical protein [Nitrospirota bacterium]